MVSAKIREEGELHTASSSQVMAHGNQATTQDQSDDKPKTTRAAADEHAARTKGRARLETRIPYPVSTISGCQSRLKWAQQKRQGSLFLLSFFVCKGALYYCTRSFHTSHHCIHCPPSTLLIYPSPISSTIISPNYTRPSINSLCLYEDSNFIPPEKAKGNFSQ